MTAWKAGRAVAVVLFCAVGLPLLILAFLQGSERVLCWANGDATKNCDGYAAVAE